MPHGTRPPQHLLHTVQWVVFGPCNIPANPMTAFREPNSEHPGLRAPFQAKRLQTRSWRRPGASQGQPATTRGEICAVW